jgi:hypothetical protein
MRLGFERALEYEKSIMVLVSAVGGVEGLNED